MKKPLLAAAAVVALALIAAWIPYRRDLTEARERLAAGSRVAPTACGPIEYAEQGAGPVVLGIHGAGGGYSQAADFARLLAASGFRAITMSRFGYLRTPMPADGSAQAQADAHACLLDALGVDTAAVFGASAGAPSAMQFCIRHARRCSALALLVPATHVPGRTWRETTPPSPFMQFVLNNVLGSDWLIWTITRVRPEILIETALATPLEVYRAASPAERERALAMARDIFPVSPKLEGLMNDGRICSALPRYALEDITAPTLAISVEDDLYGTHAGAQYTAGQIAGARFVSYPAGGHVWLGHDDDVKRELVDFLGASLTPSRSRAQGDPK